MAKRELTLAEKELLTKREAERLQKKIRSHAYWFKITGGKPGFTLSFNRALREDQEIKGLDNWKIVDEVMKSAWIKPFDQVRGVTRYAVIPLLKPQATLTNHHPSPPLSQQLGQK